MGIRADADITEIQHGGPNSVFANVVDSIASGRSPMFLPNLLYVGREAYGDGLTLADQQAGLFMLFGITDLVFIHSGISAGVDVARGNGLWLNHAVDPLVLEVEQPVTNVHDDVVQRYCGIALEAGTGAGDYDTPTAGVNVWWNGMGWGSHTPYGADTP
jgi:hypothetical protein